MITRLLLVWFGGLVLITGVSFSCAGCHLLGKQTVVVAPVGPATKAQDTALTDNQAKTNAAIAAFQGTLSKVSASALGISSMNDGQPLGPRTTGIGQESLLIQTLAGPPDDQDRLAAAERARIVAEGNAENIAKAYASAQTTAQAAKKQLGDTQVALTASNAALAKATAQAAIERQNAAAELKRQIQAIQDKAAADQRKLITWIFFGGGAALVAGGIAVLLLAGSIPIFGPKAGFAVIAAGGGLIVIGMVMNELAKHPWILWTGISLCFGAFAVAIGLIVSNHGHFKDTLVAQVKTIIAPGGTTNP